MYNHEATMRFTLDRKTADRLGSLAQRQELTIAAVLRNLVYQAINNASQQEIGTDEHLHRS